MRIRVFTLAMALGSIFPTLYSQDWRTPAEVSDYRTTPDYAETLRYLDRIVAAAPGQVKIEDFGRTGEGRDLKIVIASKDGVFDPGAIHASGRVILLVQNAIHAGEMDGKDSCLALLRDMVIAKSKAALLEHAVFVFIPAYNIDGHERRSPYNRINQNGPDIMGWRGNGTNLNLNRDYMKADTLEARAFLKLFHRWLPDLLRRRSCYRWCGLSIRCDLYHRRRSGCGAGDGEVDSRDGYSGVGAPGRCGGGM